MAGSTLASPIADAPAGLAPLAGEATRSSGTWWRFRLHRLAVAGAVLLAMMLLAVGFGPLLWQVPINDIDFSAHLDGPSWSHPFGTDDLGQDLLARMLYGGRISLAVGLAAAIVAIVIGTFVGALAAVAVAHLPVPRPAEAAGGTRARDLHPDCRGDRRLALDAGGAAGAGAILVAARKGVRRGGPGVGHEHSASGDAAHPAEFAGASDRRRDDRCRRRDHSRIDAVLFRSRLPARHSDLGTHSVRCQGLPRHRPALGLVRRRRDLSRSAVDQLHRRRIARRARSPDLGIATYRPCEARKPAQPGNRTSSISLPSRSRRSKPRSTATAVPQGRASHPISSGPSARAHSVRLSACTETVPGPTGMMSPAAHNVSRAFMSCVPAVSEHGVAATAAMIARAAGLS